MDSGVASKRSREDSDEVDGDDDARPQDEKVIETGFSDSPVVLSSMTRSVSPPPKRPRLDTPSSASPEPLRSPFQLTAIRDLPASDNVDTLTVRDVFGSPHLVECWEFNYLHDLDFLMQSFDDEAVRRGLAVHVVHGFWMSDDPRRAVLERDAAAYNQLMATKSSQGSQSSRGSQASEENKPSSITLHTAYLPEPFGTHHTKMAVLFHDDDTAQIVIHTANMIAHDWANMTQAVWRSPLLQLVAVDKAAAVQEDEVCIGDSFKKDFLNYLRAYNQRRPVCRALIEKLVRYDFSEVQAVLIGSVPGRHAVLHPSEMEELDETGATPTQWGWAAMKRALRHVPIRQATAAAAGSKSTAAEIVAQVSSIATLGGSDSWLRQTFFAALLGGNTAAGPGPNNQARVPQPWLARPQLRIVFPVADEIRRSLDGYVSGTSIHTKIQSPQQKRQLEYMRPVLCHWANDVADGEAIPDSSSAVPHGNAGRNRAAPHVKTYTRYAPDGSIEWVLLTSANLSRQAWGEAKSMMSEMRIASYELGVLVWPELLAAGATMQPVFRRDTFAGPPGPEPVVPLRIPYSLPLQRYSKTEIPWVATMPHSEPDWRGDRWHSE